MPGFNVCLPEPRGYSHSLCLLELAQLLTYSLQDLGYDAALRMHAVDPSCRNIIVGCHLVGPEHIPSVPEATIIVNTEQIYDEDRFGWNTNIFAWVRAFETWDYSPGNIAAFEKRGIAHVKLLRIGHQPQLARIRKAAEPDIDVLFYGSPTDRRQAIFDECRRRGLEVVTLFAVYGEARDAFIARSKVVLNLHNHAAEIFEIVRVHYLLSNAVAVVSEVNPTTLIPAMYRQAVSGVPYEQVADECARLVHDDAARHERECRAIRLISAFPQAEFTRRVLS